MQSNTTNGSTITLTLDSISVSDQIYCYIVTATNGTHKVLVNGSIDMVLKEGTTNAVLIAAIVVPIGVLFIVVMLVMVVMVVIILRMRYGNYKY